MLQVSKFYPPVMGGIESVAWELTEGLNRYGVTAEVLCSNQRWRTVHERMAAGYSVTRAGSLGRVLSTSMSPAMVGQMLALRGRFDLLHVHAPDPMAALVVWAARPKGKLVVHWHSDVIRQRKALALYEPLQRWLLARADAVIATSPSYADASLPLRPWRGKVEVIPIGISDNRASASSEKAAAIRQLYRNRHMVFSLGRMTSYKGFEVLIEAAADLPADSVVVIGGEGELLEPFRRSVAARGLAGKVHLLGHIPDDELPSYFEACDLFCMPSTTRAEAYGVAMVEAMVMGKAIVASEIEGSGVPWVNLDGVTGLNVPARQSRPLAEALRRLLSDRELRKRFGAAARLRYVETFNAEAMTRRTLALYRRLLPAA